MKAIKKNANSLFPFSFVYKGSKEPQNELPTHMHDFHEIIYVHKGTGTFFINNTLYDMNQGDVFLVPNDTIHHAVPNQDDLVTSSVVFFSPALIQTIPIDENFSYTFIVEKIKKHKHYKISLSETKQVTFEQFLNDIEKELREKQMGSIHAAILITHQILLYLSRLSIEQIDQTFREENLNRFWMNEIFAYIDRNLQGNISLSLLAEKAHVSPAHFSRVFKEVTGIGLIVYLNKKRTYKAKDLLRKTDYPVAHIAELSGFDSTPHFYRTFKKFIGTTPSDYRKNKKNMFKSTGD
ncbi:helix-turn-helix domain-containing protein [Gracilibacillus salitolerans]|uniref:Helix-turn-helix domain-containing protein n=1 Tax=Gracilibacillus salitolerans TaxID=2663022 RepID=A0A5Q2TE72_9BACI|nr:AraC family transcriptional regulator [Gracilibacillus salitolerans]QGH32935.1 helix-turn-helix domain-containing protein [Gracilibacillus salitolerans]